MLFPTWRTCPAPSQGWRDHLTHSNCAGFSHQTHRRSLFQTPICFRLPSHTATPDHVLQGALHQGLKGDPAHSRCSGKILEEKD